MTNKKEHPYWTVGEKILVTAPNGSIDIWTVVAINYTTLRVKGRSGVYEIKASRTHADMGQGLGPNVVGEVGRLSDCVFRRRRDGFPIKNRGFQRF
jgi:hypothetical protein